MSTKEELALKGGTLAFIAPDDSEIVIREQNGDDEEILSGKNILKGDAIHFFLAGIIISVNGKKISSNDVMNMRNRVKYHALLKSRIHSLGSELTYKHRCSNPNCTKPEGTDDPVYEEDLSLYDRDFSPKAKEDKRPDFKYRIEAYPKDSGLTREFKTYKGKELRYKFLTGVEEKKMLSMDKDKMSVNTEIKLRELEWKQPESGEWVKVENFRDFNPKEMGEIRKDIKENDMPFEAVSETTCPFCSNVDMISLLSEKDFFFLGEM